MPKDNYARQQEWKSFSNFDKLDHQRVTKNLLKDEIADITMKVAKTRESGSNSQVINTWKPNAIEHLQRQTQEGGRFYELNKKRLHGLKAVPPPGRAQSYFELKEEQQNYDFC